MPIVYGFLERITYYNEENDFVVAKLQEKGKRELTTIVGNLSGINAGESLKLSGRWVHNKKFGEQFQVEHFEVTVPATVHGIKKYLGSGLIKGIGPIMAERIVKEFDLDTLDIIEKQPERLSEVDGIGPKKGCHDHQSLGGAEGNQRDYDFSSGSRSECHVFSQDI